MSTQRRGGRLCIWCGTVKPSAEFDSQRCCKVCAVTRPCKVCGKPTEPLGSTTYRGRLCADCRKQKDAARYQTDKKRVLARNAEWRAEHAQPDSPYRERQKRLQNERRKAIRAEVLAHYGGRCACCGETEPLFLTIDHMTMNGGEHRRQIKRFDIAYWLWLNDYPDGFQVLCFNCNTGRYRNGGRCPHETAGAGLAQQDCK